LAIADSKRRSGTIQITATVTSSAAAVGAPARATDSSADELDDEIPF
jgi:hypothetical protein